MTFFLKKVRLLAFLTRRVPRFGWSQWLRGLREREVSYTAMELAQVLPSSASTIVDVGAHSGVVSDALDFLYRPRRIWVVEPNPARSSQLDSRFGGRAQFVIVKSCLGEAREEVRFNVFEFDAASSVFSCVPGHLSKLGLSEQTTALTVPMVTLRDLLLGERETLDLLKLDCQGAELSVLRGGGERLQRKRWSYCEVSIDPIYAGAPLFGELHSFLCAAGFELRHMGGFSGAGNSIQWADALYANTRLAAE